MKMKTRTNQPVEYAFDSAVDFEHLSDEFLSNLKAGDVVVKQTGEQKHSYIVSFKKDDEGMCLTYTDASVVETISYDLVDGHWVFNSKDVTPIGDMTSGNFSGKDLKAKTLEQSEANWSIDLSDVELSVPEGFSATNIFSRVQVINQELEIIFTFSVTNNGESTATPANVQLGQFDVPQSIGSKIIDVQGNPLTTSVSLVAIAGSAMINSTNPPSSANVFAGRYGILNVSHQGTKLFVACYSLQGIGAGATHTYSGRIQLTLI